MDFIEFIKNNDIDVDKLTEEQKTKLSLLFIKDQVVKKCLNQITYLILTEHDTPGAYKIFVRNIECKLIDGIVHIYLETNSKIFDAGLSDYILSEEEFIPYKDQIDVVNCI